MKLDKNLRKKLSAKDVTFGHVILGVGVDVALTLELALASQGQFLVLWKYKTFDLEAKTKQKMIFSRKLRQQLRLTTITALEGVRTKFYFLTS